MTDTEKNAIVDRFTRGQSMEFIRFAMDVPIKRIREVLAERKVKVLKHSKRNRAWGYRGGFER